MTVSSDGVALGPVTADQSGLVSEDIWLGLTKSGGVGPWFGPGWPDLPVKGGPAMAIRITDDMMVLEIGKCVVAIARFDEHAAADGNGAWIIPTHPAQRFAATRRLRH